jgi:hypothetical protein
LQVPIRKSFIVLAVILAGWMLVYSFGHRTPSSRSYQQMCVKAAHDAHDGVDLARRVTSAEMPHKFNNSVMDDARGKIANARSKVAGATPPDGPSAQRQADLLPLLDEAQKAFDEMASSSGPEAAKTAEPIEQKLREYIAENS